MSTKSRVGYLPTAEGRAYLARMHARGVRHTAAADPDRAMAAGSRFTLSSGKDPRVHAFRLHDHGGAHERALCGMPLGTDSADWDDMQMRPMSEVRRLVTCGSCLNWAGWVLAGVRS